MNKEGLTKAAEDARRASAQTLTTHGTHHFIDDVVAVTGMRLSYDEVAESAFTKGAEWAMSQPLAEKLTDEEKEKIKAIYFRNVYSVADVQSNFTEKCLIDALFGADLFK